MKHRIRLFSATAATLALPFLLVACDKEVSHTSSTSVNSDGSSKTKEKVVTQSDNGTVTKEEVKKTVTDEGATKTEEKTTVKSPDGTVTKEESKTATPPTMP
ncbi:MAG: hypothetical protein K8S99_03740 [Planctomycetes bacterium]|nr:hypothetical protein [Planctomycetota bacterium]